MEFIRKRDELNLINEKSTINYNSPAASLAVADSSWSERLMFLTGV